VGLLAIGVAHLGAQERRPLPKGSVPDQKKEPDPLPPQQQVNGLPAGAVARLGHTRLRHADKPTCVAFAPDGKTFITGGDDGTVRVWAVATGEQVAMLQKPGLSVSALKFTHSGKRLAAQFGSNGLVHFLDATTLREIGATAFVGSHKFDFSPDGALMATSDLAGNLVVTEVENDLPKLELTGANLFAFRPDGKAIAVSDAKGTVTVHLITGGKPTHTMKLDGAIAGLAYSPNGTRLAVGVRGTGGADVIRVFEGGKEKPVAEIAGMNQPKVWIGSDALACGNGAAAGVYDLAKKQWAGRVKEMAGEFAVSSDGTKLAATGSGLRVRLWDLPTGKQLHAENDSFPDPALLVGSADGRALFVLSTDTAYHWTVGAGAARPAGTLPGLAVAAAVGGGKLVVATPDAVLVYANFDPTKPLPAKPALTFKDSAGAKAVAISDNGARVAWTVDGGKVIVADITDKEPRREPPVTTTTVFALSFNQAGDRLAALGRDPYLRVWDVSAESTPIKEAWKARVQRGQKGAVAFSPDGKLLTAVSTAQLAVFDATDGKEPAEPREPLFRGERSSDNGAIHHATFSPDGRLLVVGAAGMYGRVEVWEMATRGLVRAFSTGYGGTARLCIFPDGSRAVSAGAEEAITVWDLTFRGDKPAPEADELLTALNNLGSPNPANGYPAIKVFVAAGPRGAEYLDTATKETVANNKKIKEWIEDLGSETFSVRENASKELVAQGGRALPALQIAVNSEDPEVRDRAREVMGKLNAKGVYPPSYGLVGDQLRLFRTVQAIEEIGGKEAKTVLEAIVATGGRPGAEAKAALARMKK
jgi:WD40 repeat protein